MAIGAGLAVGLTAVGVMAIVAIAVAVYYKRKKQRPLPPTPAGAGIIYNLPYSCSLQFIYLLSPQKSVQVILWLQSHSMKDHFRGHQTPDEVSLVRTCHVTLVE